MLNVPVADEEKKGNLENLEIGEDPFTEDDFKKCWDAFIAIKKEQNTGESELMMLRQDLSINQNVATLTLGNSVQHDIFNKVQTDLHMHIRRSLNNRNITVTTHLHEDEIKDMLYTNREKFEYMVKQNPTLRELQQRLGLDPDI